MSETPYPKSILRGHKAQVHALCFIRGNDRLVSGDADGFIAVWDLTIKRPVAVWQAHEKAILGVQGWDEDRIITHGRDNKLAVWKLGAPDEAILSKKLPLDSDAGTRPTPWLLHMIPVNTMNFCSFASCVPQLPGSTTTDEIQEPELLLAVPNTLASESVRLFVRGAGESFPYSNSERQIDVYHLPSQKRLCTVKSPGSHGMVMALRLLHVEDRRTLIAGYEDGVAAIIQETSANSSQPWRTIYTSKTHSQPILSLDVAPDQRCFFTSSADAIVAKHAIPSVQSRGLGDNAGTADESSTLDVSGTPSKINNTKHAGQQGLQLRDDGRIFATGGWDSTIRVYSTKTLNEVAALQYHQAGCYAVAFAGVLRRHAAGAADTSSKNSLQVVGSVKEKRINLAQTAHWLAAGCKDGKISLWDVF